jgi:hypothetical protein
MKNNQIKQAIIDFSITFIICYIVITCLSAEINIFEWHILVRAFHIFITLYIFGNIQLNILKNN